MARLVLTEDEAAICQVVGVRAFAKARSQVVGGDLADIRWDRFAGHGHAAVRGATSGWTTASVAVGADGRVAGIEGGCTCDLAPGCVHPTALVLAAYATDPAGHATAPSWESALATILGGDDAAGDSAGAGESFAAGLALQFDLEDDEGNGQWRIALRPVVPGKKGWVRSGISWSSLNYAYRPPSSRAQQHVNLLLELSSLAESDGRDPYGYYLSGRRVIHLDDFRSRRVWDVLAEAQEVACHSCRAAGWRRWSWSPPNRCGSRCGPTGPAPICGCGPC